MSSPIRVVAVPCLKDNYAYLVYRTDGDGECLVVDPSEAAPVVRAVEQHGLRLTAIFNTHHHWDHIGGNRDLLERGPLEVYGYEAEIERIDGLNRPLSDTEEFSVANMHWFVLHVPGHTSGALALCSKDRSVCFTGDTLFCGGCGRLFEGTPQQMHHSLTSVLGQLPDETTIYCGHEYTEKNLAFARTFEESEALENRHVQVQRRRAEGRFCASASLGLERETNPFLRCHLAHLQEALGAPGNEREAFAALRRAKDRA